MSYGQELMLPGSQGCQLQSYVLNKASIPGEATPGVCDCLAPAFVQSASKLTQVTKDLVLSFSIPMHKWEAVVMIQLSSQSSGMLYGTCLEPELARKIHCHDTQMFCRQAARCQDVQTVVRYNQRGVGSSCGSRSLWGAQDMADATALCQHILAMHNGPTHLHLVG